MDFDQNISNASSALPADGRDFLTGFQHRNPLSTIPGHHIFIQLFGTFPYILYSLLFMYREEAEKAKKKKIIKGAVLRKVLLCKQEPPSPVTWLPMDDGDVSHGQVKAGLRLILVLA